MQIGKPLLRKMKDGRIINWNVQSEDALCTLQEAFEKVNTRLGFNVELKFDDNLEYKEEELTRVLQSILKACVTRQTVYASFEKFVDKFQSNSAMHLVCR
jgi:ribosome-associated translation inhibitor RaiA